LCAPIRFLLSNPTLAAHQAQVQSKTICR
jgi:hypothetical protein